MAPRRVDQAPAAVLIEPVEFLLPRLPPWPRVEPTELPSPRPSSTNEPSCSSYRHKLLVNPNIARYPLEITHDSTRNYSENVLPLMIYMPQPSQPINSNTKLPI
jgi:hypothetical protein